MTTTIIEQGAEIKKEIKVIKCTSDMEIDFVCYDATKDEMSVSQFMERQTIFLFNDPIQRNAVWSIEKKSLLIVSILEEVSIGEIKTQAIRKHRKKYRNVLDGKQRLTTIRDYVRNRFALKDSLVQSFDEVGEEVRIDVSGMYFKNLPKQYQNRILALILDIKSYEDLDDSKKADLFKRWNNGQALKPSQIRKAMMSYELLHAIAEMKGLEAIQAGFSPNGLKNENHSDMLLKALCVLKTQNNTALDSKTIDGFLNQDAFTTEDIEELKELATYLNESFKFADEKSVKKSFGASKSVTLIYVAKQAMKDNRSHEDFASWIHQLFVKDYNHTGYATTSGTTKLESVKRKNSIGLEHYNKCFA
ncbi:DUF262 domain-containing protein [Bacillus sp. NPDC094106]|uniref:DUF262 domain-containing protein n=1 Tax=Bacillus sp. NPDC094106 TaxID=3363949 RepID=UPI00382F1664